MTRTFSVLDDADAHAHGRAEEATVAGLDQVRDALELMRREEWQLVDAVDHVAHESLSALESIATQRETLHALESRLASRVEEIDRHLVEIADFEQSPPKDEAAGVPPSSACMLDLFRVQASAKAARILDGEAQKICKNVVDATQRQIAKLEAACAERSQRLQRLLCAPQRRSPDERLRTTAIGMERFIENVSGVGRRAPDGGSADAPMHLLRGTYAYSAETPSPHQQTTLCNSFDENPTQGDMLMARRLKRQEAQRARFAASTIVMGEQRGFSSELEEVRAVSC